MVHVLIGNSPNSFLIILLIILLRYLILASVAFLIFYVVWKRKKARKKIQLTFPARSDYHREIAYSVSTAVIFATMGYFFFFGSLAKFTRVYYDLNQHSLWYLLMTVGLTLALHDTYFYWMHRAMHHPKIFPWFHKVHHLSTNPSPWAAMAFHPLEAVAEFMIIVIASFIYPIHPIAIALFLLIMMAYNVYGHLGYELYPRQFSSSRIGKWINTSISHNQHHQYYKGNYGLYFLWWDRWMGTIRPDYDDHFNSVKERKG